MSAKAEGRAAKGSEGDLAAEEGREEGLSFMVSIELTKNDRPFLQESRR